MYTENVVYIHNGMLVSLKIEIVGLGPRWLTRFIREVSFTESRLSKRPVHSKQVFTRKTLRVDRWRMQTLD